MICENRHSCFQERTCFNDLSEWALQHHDEQSWGIFAVRKYHFLHGMNLRAKPVWADRIYFGIEVIRVWGRTER